MTTKLFIGPFPTFLDENEKENLLFYFGAEDVNHVVKKNKSYSIAL